MSKIMVSDNFDFTTLYKGRQNSCWISWTRIISCDFSTWRQMGGSVRIAGEMPGADTILPFSKMVRSRPADAGKTRKKVKFGIIVNGDDCWDLECGKVKATAELTEKYIATSLNGALPDSMLLDGALSNGKDGMGSE